MKIIFKIVVVSALLAIASLVRAEIYKWVDEKGTVNFTDDPSTIPEKFKNQTKSSATQEDHMTLEERMRANEEQKRQTNERIKRDRGEYEKSLKEENSRKAKKEFDNALDKKKLEREKEIRRQEEAIKKEQKEKEDAYKGCWNCDGKGYIRKEVVESRGGVPDPSGRSFYVDKPCSICGGTGYLKK
jgi:isoleucyl-tRNA synthetase